MAAVASGPRLVIPLRLLAPATTAEPRPGETTKAEPTKAPPTAGPPPVARLLHLDERPDSGMAGWVEQVRASAEACLAINSAGRVVALSASCGDLLELQPDGAVGALLLDLVYMVDFTHTGLPLADAERSTPPLRALRSGRLARGLVRLRLPMAGTSTFDVVGVPLADGVGALGFLTRV